MLERLKVNVGRKKLLPKKEDSLKWLHDNKSEFFVKRMSKLLIEYEEQVLNFDFDKILKLKVSLRVKSFLWMMVIGRIPMKEFLIRRGVQFHQMKKKYPWCDKELERSKHLFFKCKYAEGFWKIIFYWWEIRWTPVDDFMEFYKLCNKVYLLRVLKCLWLISVVVACWSLWMARNEVMFYKKMVPMETLMFH